GLFSFIRVFVLFLHPGFPVFCFHNEIRLPTVLPWDCYLQTIRFGAEYHIRITPQVFKPSPGRGWVRCFKMHYFIIMLKKNAGFPLLAIPIRADVLDDSLDFFLFIRKMRFSSGFLVSLHFTFSRLEILRFRYQLQRHHSRALEVNGNFSMKIFLQFWAISWTSFWAWGSSLRPII